MRWYGPWRSAVTGASLAGAALILSACAGSGQMALKEAQASVQAIHDNPTVQQFAPVERDRADEALQSARRAQEAGAGQAEVEHLAYVTKHRATIAETRAATRSNQARIDALSEEREQIQLAAKGQEAAAARQRASVLEKQLADLRAEQTERGLVLTLGDILFDFDRSNLKPGGEQQIARLAEALKSDPERTVLIEGHTDSTGSAEYNRLLSQRRADAVGQGLLAHDIAPERLTMRGLGEDYPLATNATRDGRQENRRVEVIVQE